MALPLLTSNENVTDVPDEGLTNIYQFDTDSYKYGQTSPITKRNGAFGKIGIDLPNTTVDQDGVITVND